MAPISDLCDQARTYLDPPQVEAIYRAYLLGAEAHRGQQRATGDPYITHPVEVARVLVGMRLDTESVIAGMLHDVMEDTSIDKERIARDFGKEVAELVDGVTKLSQIEAASRDVVQAENYRKMLLAMTDDVRVMLVKLADRLHNMRTIDALAVERRRRIARETLEIYAPIAIRLGLNHVKEELEDLGFRALYPNRYRVIQAELRRTRGNRKRAVKNVQTAIRRRLRQEGLEARVLGRDKHIYSVYRKMRTKRLPLEQVLDVHGIRILVDSVDMCYRVLGSVHNLYKPRPGRFKDYIAIPKANGYQSLHTVLFGPRGLPIEVQVRSSEMHEIAESGIAAHVLYKDGNARDSVAHRRCPHLDARDTRDAEGGRGPGRVHRAREGRPVPGHGVRVHPGRRDTRARARLDPGRLRIRGPHGHRDTCEAARIDGRPASLRTPLATGQTVEIVTSRKARPDPTWINFVVTGKARVNIRGYLKKLHRDEAIDLGRRLLDQALRREDLSLRKLPKGRGWDILDEFRLDNRDELFADIGLGRRAAALVAKRLAATARDPETAEKEADLANGRDTGEVPIFIAGTEGMVVNLGKCCRPIPGDLIVGFLSSGRGLVVHTGTCGNLPDLDSKHESIDVDWAPKVAREFPVDIRIEVENRKGVLATVAAAISGLDVNIDGVGIVDRDGINSELAFTIEVTGRTHLAQVFRRIRALPLVRRIIRHA